MKYSWNNPLKNREKILNQKIQIGDTVKIINCCNTGGINKNGRTGTVTRIEGDQYEVRLHCTHTGGNDVKTIYDANLDKYVGLTNVKQWFDKEDIKKC